MRGWAVLIGMLITLGLTGCTSPLAPSVDSTRVQEPLLYTLINDTFDYEQGVAPWLTQGGGTFTVRSSPAGGKAGYLAVNANSSFSIKRPFLSSQRFTLNLQLNEFYARYPLGPGEVARVRVAAYLSGVKTTELVYGASGLNPNADYYFMGSLAATLGASSVPAGFFGAYFFCYTNRGPAGNQIFHTGQSGNSIYPNITATYPLPHPSLGTSIAPPDNYLLIQVDSVGPGFGIWVDDVRNY